MADVQTEGNIVWDRKALPHLYLCPLAHRQTVSSPAPSDDRSDYFSNAADSLPPFALLTSDEERESRAESCTPGTYHVVMVPDSFSSLPEYSTEAIEDPEASALGRPKSENVDPDDPNVVILKTFEDISRRPTSTGRTSRVSPISEIADPLCALSLSPALASPTSPALIEDDNLDFLDSLLDQHNQHATLFAHFRHVVWKQLFPRDHGFGDSYGPEGQSATLSVDFLEHEADRFPPVCNRHC